MTLPIIAPAIRRPINRHISMHGIEHNQENFFLENLGERRDE
jgi:hypothetical protein